MHSCPTMSSPENKQHPNKTNRNHQNPNSPQVMNLFCTACGPLRNTSHVLHRDGQFQLGKTPSFSVFQAIRQLHKSLPKCQILGSVHPMDSKLHKTEICRSWDKQDLLWLHHGSIKGGCLPAGKGGRRPSAENTAQALRGGRGFAWCQYRWCWWRDTWPCYSCTEAQSTWLEIKWEQQLKRKDTEWCITLFVACLYRPEPVECPVEPKTQSMQISSTDQLLFVRDQLG